MVFVKYTKLYVILSVKRMVKSISMKMAKPLITLHVKPILACADVAESHLKVAALHGSAIGWV